MIALQGDAILYPASTSRSDGGDLNHDDFGLLFAHGRFGVNGEVRDHNYMLVV
jgi:hypothetical protein